MTPETYLVAVTVNGHEKKDRRLAHNKRTLKIDAKVSTRTADAILAIAKKKEMATVDTLDDIIETAISYYAKLLREGIRV